jgi:hypothetical protein
VELAASARWCGEVFDGAGFVVFDMAALVQRSNTRGGLRPRSCELSRGNDKDNYWEERVTEKDLLSFAALKYFQFLS